jgi:hypothetical protein
LETRPGRPARLYGDGAVLLTASKKPLENHAANSTTFAPEEEGKFQTWPATDSANRKRALQARHLENAQRLLDPPTGLAFCPFKLG